MRFATICMAVSLCAACGRTPADVRGQVFPSCRDLAVDQRQWSAATMVVIYWPQVRGCVPCELPALQSLSRASRESPDIQLLLVLPADASNPVQKLSVDWPGKIVRLDRRRYDEQVVLTPLPRIEVWDRGGRLLLLKTVPPNLDQAAALGDEVRWAKARALPRRKKETSDALGRVRDCDQHPAS